MYSPLSVGHFQNYHSLPFYYFQTSYTVSFALYNLARNPEKQRTLQKEIDSVVDNDSPLTIKQIQKMNYLANVLRESGR